MSNTWKSISSCKYAKPRAASWAIFNLDIHDKGEGILANKWSSKLLLGISSYTKSRCIPLSSSSAQYPTNLTRFGWLTTPRKLTSFIHSLCPWILEQSRYHKVTNSKTHKHTHTKYITSNITEMLKHQLTLWLAILSTNKIMSIQFSLLRDLLDIVFTNFKDNLNFVNSV